MRGTDRTASIGLLPGLGGLVVLGFVFLAAISFTPAQANPEVAAPTVAASIQPLHSLLAGLVDEDQLLAPLLPANASPHSHALRPSEARRLRSADVVFWIGPEMESMLTRPIGNLSADVRVVQLLPMVSGADTAKDPHIWLDPLLAAAMVQHMAGVLA
ncbi:MAG: zinc ABC transporter substrate-binding protein, partial [Sphingomonadales bacterium]